MDGEIWTASGFLQRGHHSNADSGDPVSGFERAAGERGI
jgi:hypothetical protein